MNVNKCQSIYVLTKTECKTHMSWWDSPWYQDCSPPAGADRSPGPLPVEYVVVRSIHPSDRIGMYHSSQHYWEVSFCEMTGKSNDWGWVQLEWLPWKSSPQCSWCVELTAAARMTTCRGRDYQKAGLASVVTPLDWHTPRYRFPRLSMR